MRSAEPGRPELCAAHRRRKGAACRRRPRRSYRTGRRPPAMSPRRRERSSARCATRSLARARPSTTWWRRWRITSKPSWPTSARRRPAARRSGPSSSTTTSRPAPCRPSRSRSVKRRGCLVIRGTFDRAQAERWDRDIVEYVEGNHFFESYSGPADRFFSAVKSKPAIYPIYWSSAQMEARQHPRMAVVQDFLSSLWIHESGGRTWFEPDRNLLYPDRIRRRPPGVTSLGSAPAHRPRHARSLDGRGLPASVPPPLRR